LRYGGNTSCVEVRAGDDLLILDAGTGIRALGDDWRKEFGARPINASLLISHMHWDHIQGLPFFSPAYSPNDRIRVIGAHGRRAVLERALKNQMSPLNFPVGLDQMQGVLGVEELSSDHAQLGRFSIRVTELNHPGGCAGFRIEADGSTVAYLPDHEPYHSASAKDIDPRTRALVEFVRDVDLLILDTQYTAAEYENRVGWGHGSLPESVALAVAADVRRLALFHHDPSHNDGQIDQMVAAAQKLAGPSQLFVHGATEDETITLGGTLFSAHESALPEFVKAGAA
jgi:phosphoribosyl 1,2-cyclic phosphodiesterase